LLLEKSKAAQDDDGNTALHHAYDMNLPVVRDLIRKNIVEITKVSNNLGYLPPHMLHSCEYLSENEEEVRFATESDVSIDDYLKFKSEEF
jgi:hypothetical protein